MKENYADYRHLRPADPDGLQKWRDDNAQREEEFARQRRLEERERRRVAQAAAANEVAQLRSELEKRLIALEAENADLRDTLVDAMSATADGLNGIMDQLDLSREQRDEIHQLKIEVAKLGSTLAELREQRAKGTFHFSRERDAEVTELPNPLPPREIN